MIYAVVETFEADGTKSLCSVPKNWLINDPAGKLCVYWPPKNVAKHLSRQCSPDRTWKTHKCRILRDNIGKNNSKKQSVIIYLSFFQIICKTPSSWRKNTHTITTLNLSRRLRKKERLEDNTQLIPSHRRQYPISIKNSSRLKVY